MIWSTRSRKRNNLLRLLVYIKPFWPAFTAATLCGLVKMLSPVAVAWLIGQAVNVLSSVQSGALSAPAAWRQLLTLSVSGIIIAILTTIPVYFRSTFGARAVQIVVNQLRCDLYAHMQKLSHSFFDANRSGSLTSRLIGDIDAIQPFIGRAFVQIWMSIGMISVVLGYFFYENIYLGLFSITLLPIQMLVQRMIGWKVKANTLRTRDRMAVLAGSVQEKLAATTVVKTFTREEDEVQRFLDDSAVLVETNIRDAQLNGLSQACNIMLRSLAQLLVILLGGYLAIFHLHEITVGLLIQFILMQGQLYTPFEWLNEMQLLMANAMGATDRIFSIFDTDPEVADKPEAIKAPRFHGEILFQDVTFTYPGSHQPVLQGITLSIPAHTTMALVGPSGGGKTTMTSLLNRFYEWEVGHILIDGRDLHDYTIYSLRHQIGLVPQEPILFSGSIEENIKYGRPDATEDEIRDAAHKAYADDFIDAMEDGYQTMLGERGVRLSGGQKQRIAIARAFLKDPAILVLDEATSALDSESERIVQLALFDLMQGRTTLIIAHRLATVRQANQIAVIDGGKIVDIGKHDELLQRDGLYATLCRQQFGDAMLSSIKTAH